MSEINQKKTAEAVFLTPNNNPIGRCLRGDTSRSGTVAND